MTFWDFCAPIYDLAQKQQKAYKKVVNFVAQKIPQNSSVIEIAGGTGEFSIAVAKTAKKVVCSDISENMLKVAKRKAKKQGFVNISFEIRNIYEIAEQDESFDFVLAPQVLHLLDNPKLAAAELRRICRKSVILPQCLLKNCSKFAKLKVSIWRLFGFNDKIQLDLEDYKKFLAEIGFENCEFTYFESNMPMAVAIWSKK